MVQLRCESDTQSGGKGRTLRLSKVDLHSHFTRNGKIFITAPNSSTIITLSNNSFTLMREVCPFCGTTRIILNPLGAMVAESRRASSLK